MLLHRGFLPAVAALFLLVPVRTPLVQVQSGDMAVVRGIDGSVRRFTGVRFVHNALNWRDGQASFRDVIAIEFIARRTRPAPALVVLSNHDQIAMQIATIDEEKIVGARGGSSVSIPLEFVRAVALRLPETTVARANRWKLLTRQPKEDNVSLAGGDRLVGELRGLAAEQLSLETSAGPRKVPLKRITTIQFSSELLSEVPGKAAIAIVQTTKEDIITISGLRKGADGALILNAVWGETLRVKPDNVRSLTMLHDRIVHLGDLPAAMTTHQPSLGKPRKPKADQTVIGTPMLHDRERFPKGIGATSRMELTWNLTGEYDSFTSRCGIDDSAPRGTAVFVVHVDDHEVFRSGVVRGGEPLLSIPPLRLNGAKQLRLTVEYGPRADLQDVANWVLPVLSKHTGPQR